MPELSPEFDSSLIDKIVSEVLRRVGEARQSNPTAEPTTATRPSSDEIKLSDKVISLESLRGKWKGTRRLIVNSRSIVTPAVRDELRTHKIELVRESSQAATPSEATTRGSQVDLIVARLSGNFQGIDWLKPLARTKVICGDDHCQMTSRLLDALNKFETNRPKAICFSPQPHVAVADLNRSPGIRAAFAREVRELVEIEATLHPSVLILDASLNRAGQQALIESWMR